MGTNNRGFYFNDEGKINLNLSEIAWNVIDEDRKTFSNGDELKEKRSNFLNRIFTNFYETANASIQQRIDTKRSKYTKMLTSKESTVRNQPLTPKYIDELVKAYKSKLRSDAKSYEKGHAEKFRLNKENQRLLEEDFQNAAYYESSPGAYLKPIFEEYARKPVFEREAIYFADVINEIKAAIGLKKQLKITDKDTIYYFTPYKIVQDKARIFNYVVGYSQKANDEDGSSLLAVSRRISRIEVKCQMSKDKSLTLAAKKKIDEKIKEKGAQFLAGKAEKIIVKFTDSGLSQYTRHLFMRPENYEKLDKYTYAFDCTAMQAENYFFKFGKDAQIIEPKDLREKIVQKYKEAFEEYSK